MVLYVLNYITFIIALFEKLDKIRGDELMKIIDERQMNGRSKRLLSQPHYVVNNFRTFNFCRSIINTEKKTTIKIHFRTGLLIQNNA